VRNWYSPGELAVGVVGGVLNGSPDVVPQLAVLPELPEFPEQDLRPDRAVDGDLVAPPLRRGRDQDAAWRHASTVVRDTANRRAATAIDTLGSPWRRCSSKIWAASRGR
jgi:hypothetical protein